MAKRLTDTEKWNDEWFVSLDNDYKIIWQWLIDNCNHAGICKRSINILNSRCRTNITEKELIDNMDGRVLVVENTWFIPKFLKFQYTTLKSRKPTIVSVVKMLLSGPYWLQIPESFGNNYKIIPESLLNDPGMNKDTDKDKDKDNTGNTKQQKTENHNTENQEEILEFETEILKFSNMNPDGKMAFRVVIGGLGEFVIKVIETEGPPRIREIERFLTMNEHQFQVVAKTKREMNDPEKFRKTLQHFVYHIQERSQEQTYNSIQTHFLNWLNSLNGKLEKIIYPEKVEKKKDVMIPGSPKLRKLE